MGNSIGSKKGKTHSIFIISLGIRLFMYSYVAPQFLGYIYIYICLNLQQFLILCSLKAMMFVKLYFRTSDIYLISLVSLDPSGFTCERKRCHPLKKKTIYDVYCISRRQYQRFLNSASCSARRCCRGRGFESR